MTGKINTTLGLVAALFLMIAASVGFHLQSGSVNDSVERAQNNFTLKEKRVTETMNWLNNQLSQSRLDFNESLLSESDYLDKEEITLLAYRNDSLKFWTSNLAPVDQSLRELNDSEGMLHLRNGWYYYQLRQNKNLKLFGLLLISKEYDVQNSYFKNGFVTWLNLSEDCKLNAKGKLEHPVLSTNKKILFGIDKNENSLNGKSTLPAVLFFIGLLIFAFTLIRYGYRNQINLKQLLAGSIVLIALRSLMVYFEFPSYLYASPLYDVGVYGITDSFFNRFLGDIIINVVLFFIWSVIFIRHFHPTIQSAGIKWAGLSIYLIVLVLLSLQLNSTVKNLIFNSTIPLDFSGIFNLSPLSFLCLAIVFINGFTIMLLIEKMIKLLFENNKKEGLIALILSLLLHSLIFLFVIRNSFSAVEWFWLPILIFISIAFRKYNYTESILSAGFRVLAFAIITAWIFGEYTTTSEKQSLNHLSEKLSDRQDAFLESEFLKVASKIKKDSSLHKAVRRLPLQNNETERLLRQLYFTRYFEKYTVELSVFDSLCMPYLKNTDYNLNNHDYFDEQIKTGEPTICEDLYFIPDYKKNSRYIGKIDLRNGATGGKPAYSLYVQLEPKQFTNGGSFSELLLDEPQQKQSRYKQFSYAIYKNGVLSSAYGNYIYPHHFGKEVLEQNTKEYSHSLTVPDKETQLVLSYKNKGFNYYFTANSYYFLFYSLIGIVLFAFYYVLSNKENEFFTLNRRIQLFVVGFLFLALGAVGIFTVDLVIKKSEDEQSRALIEKAAQLQNELNSVLFYNKSIDLNSKPFTESVLQKYAALFNSDISLYNKNGLLFASSRPQLFNSGLSSGLMSPKAILHFKENKSHYFITRDRTGSLNYLSLYTALYDANRKLTGYMNLPYFSRQKDVEEGVSDYITTLINIYVVLFLVSLFAGLIVSAYVTKPLRILQEQLAKISFGKKNEAISWQSNDEIGRLVNEYNKMLLKLEESASLLAKSEREGAWQEMAKQVAHEIKNPLTPMKLNLQYLQKIVNDGGIDFSERFKKMSDSIIEQIDTLAHIANEFSNFAKLPKANLEQVNLTESIRSTIELFKNNHGVQIDFINTSESVKVLADKNQCLRVFNNLIKNAVQSIPDGREGRIEISIEESGESVLVKIKDNGMGIADDLKNKIFTPNFTTKSTGTGLGLAMVKNIMVSFSGDISFESVVNEGTTFTLKFKKAQ